MLLSLEMVKGGWVLGPLNLSPRKLVFVMLAVTLCHHVVGKIHQCVIHTKAGTILHQTLGGGSSPRRKKIT